MKIIIILMISFIATKNLKRKVNGKFNLNEIKKIVGEAN